MAVSRTKSVERLDPRFQERRTTMPLLSSKEKKDPRRSPGGPPAEPVDRMLGKLEDPEGAELLLIEHLSEEQRAQDAAEWWDTADRYVKRTAHMAEKGRRYFSHLPYQPAHLLSRLARTLKLALLKDALEMRARQVSWALTVERADAVRMADIPVTEAEMQLGRPMLDEDDRRALTLLAEYPLSVWQERQDRIRKTQRELSGLRREVEEAKARALEAEARGRDEEAARPKDLARPQAAPPGRRSRRR
jgi:hypothetical protein